MKTKAYKYTIDECRTAYWDACAQYEDVKRDRYSTYWQINAAAVAVAHWRNQWVKAVERSHRREIGRAAQRADAVAAVCAETGEDVVWVLNHAKRN